MADDTSIKIRYQSLHRFMCGLTVVCVLVAIAAGVVAGIRIGEIAIRSVVVVAALLVIENILIRFWAMWERSSSRQESDNS